MVWQLLGYVPITATLVIKTGNHIGGNKDAVGVDELDLPVIFHPHNRQPYLPGSSIKGKMRSLSEYRLGLVKGEEEKGGKESKGRDNKEVGSPHGCKSGDCLVCKIFGPHKLTDHLHGPSRLIVRDALLSKDSQNQWKEFKEERRPFTETKIENSINRATGASAGSGQGGVREQERVPPGVTFDFVLSLRVFDGDDRKKIEEFIRTSLDWMQKDYLGGSGTRGYGWIELQNLNFGELEK